MQAATSSCASDETAKACCRVVVLHLHTLAIQGGNASGKETTWGRHTWPTPVEQEAIKDEANAIQEQQPAIPPVRNVPDAPVARAE